MIGLMLSLTQDYVSDLTNELSGMKHVLLIFDSRLVGELAKMCKEAIVPS
jgi:hypothetical protein